MDDTEFQKLLNAEPPVVLEGNKPLILKGTKNIGYILFAIAVALLCIFDAFNHVTIQNPANFIAIALIFGLGIHELFSPSFPVCLTLDMNGFVIKPLCQEKYLKSEEKDFKSRGIKSCNKWVDVSEFKVNKGTRSKQRVWYNDNTNTNPRRDWVRSYVGGDYNLGNNYGLTLTQLAQLMNHWRERALQQNK